MPMFRFGNIWNSYDISDIFVITGNSFVRNDGKLTMGRGIALEARIKFPDIDKIFGKMVVSKCGHLGIYNIIIYERIFLLQTKISFKDKSTIELIKDSINKLKTYITPDKIVNMVFPGIGFGGLCKEEVYQNCLMDLPLNVTVWYNK